MSGCRPRGNRVHLLPILECVLEVMQIPIVPLPHQHTKFVVNIPRPQQTALDCHLTNSIVIVVVDDVCGGSVGGGGCGGAGARHDGLQQQLKENEQRV